jgi:tetratricopeptide (TPR) repeat protein
MSALLTLQILTSSRPSKLKEPIVIHLKHTLQEVRDHEGFENMPKDMRDDLALTLAEASRFQKVEWKKLAVALAKEVAYGVNSTYVRYCIAARESLLCRITGNYTQAVHVIDTTLDRFQRRFDIDVMVHVAAGYLHVQRAMNYFQNEQLAMSLKALDAWQPLQDTPAEKAVVFHITILRGRILRFQGKFHESFACLKGYTVGQFDDLFFDDELCDLACEVADTLRELDDPERGEQLLRRQLAHQEQALSKPLLRLSLAESLFAQGKFAEAEALCSDVKSQRLSKMENLRLCITLAKLRHIEGDWGEAFEWWTKALVAMSKFPPTSGLATRTIYFSICDVLRRQGFQELELNSRKEVAILERVSANSEAKHWIPGFRHWLILLRSKEPSE